MITVNPGFVFGPVVSSRTDSTSVKFISSFLDGTRTQLEQNMKFTWIDVRDVVKAHINAFTNTKATGRYLCCHKESVAVPEIGLVLSKNFTNHPVPTKIVGDPIPIGNYDNSKLIELIGDLIPLENSLKDMVASLISFKIIK